VGNLAAVYHDRGELASAAVLAERALAIRKKVLPAVHPSISIALNNLALIAGDSGDPEQSERLLHEAIAGGESGVLRDHPTLAIFYLNLAELFRKQRRFREAEPALRRALEIFDRKAADHPRAADALVALASLFLDQGKASGAEKLLVRALAIREKTGDQSSPQYAETKRFLVDVFRHQNRNTEAERLERSFR
jgi:tetratricopeptide (TPR) repeat protein